MSRKDTVWGARHKEEELEIERIIDYYRDTLNIEITKIEASAIQAIRSRDVIWNSKKAKDVISSLRGIL